MIDKEEDPKLFAGFGEYDWYTAGRGERLHWADVTGHDDEIKDEWAVTSEITLACGVKTDYLAIPGMFTRMGAMRCKRCCRKLGYPEGKGSPKNDPAIRKILGLPPIDMERRRVEAEGRYRLITGSHPRKDGATHALHE